jgi:lipopolysaccharide transport system ATP-binding protein
MLSNQDIVVESADLRPESQLAVVSVRNVSKVFNIYDQPQDRLKQYVWPRIQRALKRKVGQFYREFWALKDISFEVRRGETLGIIGRNGAGKSTLLQIVCGILRPSSGRVRVNGRIAALLELGSGFNPEFTGRENIYINGSILGLTTTEIDARLHQIIDFAGIGDFIDQPVKVYSSGMFVRLAFAVIAHVDADVLVIDEALAVGDVFFQQKCMRFLRAFQESGGTVILVTHDSSAVLSFCQRALLLSNSRPPVLGPAEDVCKIYLEDIYKERAPLPIHSAGSSGKLEISSNLIKGALEPASSYNISSFCTQSKSFGEGKATIIDAGFFDAQGVRLNNINAEERVRFIISAKVNQTMDSPAFGFMLKNKLGEYVFTEGTDKAFRRHALTFKVGQLVRAVFEFDMPQLIRGTYTINVALAEGVGDDHQQQHWIHDAVVLEVTQGRLVHGICGMHNLSTYIEFNT